ncbi:MAG: glycoside hydrolase family 10 protein, partial [Chitinophagaceae bacterium]
MIAIKNYVFAVVMVFSFFSIACKKESTGSTNNPPPPPPPPPTPVWDSNALRGVWVTTTASTALDSRNNIKNMVTTCKAANINNIFVVVYNNQRTMYPSTVMQNLIGVNILERFAGRDPLQECIEEAHAQRIKVHAWFEYGFASSYSANGGAIVAAKPHWAARVSGGALCVKNSFDWLNGLHPEVQQFMIDLFKEVTTKYNVDGVQGDDRLPAMPTTGGYDTYTSNLYLTENGVAPPTNSADGGWVNWRAKKLNSFLKRLRTEVKAIKPTIQFTMSPSPYPWGVQEYLQDWPTWVDSGWVDAIIPQCYRYDISAYNGTIAQQKSYYKNSAVPFYPGVLLKSGTYTADNSFLTQMIQANRAAGFKGECFFFYEGIKDRTTWFSGIYPFTK